MDEMSIRLDDGTNLEEDQKKIFKLWTAQNQFLFLFFVLTKIIFFFF
jgi:hypothetical protein